MTNGTRITIVGNLTDDPELRFTPSGSAVAKFSVAVNRRTFDRQANEWKEAGADFHRVTAWRTLAENVAATLAKGTRVIVVGDLRQSSWKDDKTGETRYSWELAAEAVGPDLTFATATVAKVAKTSGSAPGDDAWATASRTRPAVPAGASVPAPAGGQEPQAEPPF
ncbi:single-stranded DNA-binding protein [Streptomyces sp. NPDC056491]|uniref:single-stranded DNA-binding protein n=1 Tax=Streptomyces sp. NPDC056491 TaxID=3345837 RepID=UPI0036C0A82C